MQGMIKRLLTRQLQERLGRYPAVALIGPRQVGKTTLAKSLGGRYFDLENHQDRLRLSAAWADLVAGDELVVLDEVQAMPEVFPRLRSAIDADRKRVGRFLLLGSVSPSLMKHVGESLAGRLALCELTPLLIEEVPARRQDTLWRVGGYPDGGIQDEQQFPHWQNYYLDLMAQRDLPNWGLPARPALTKRMFAMLAANHGCVWNASQIGKSLALSYHTVNRYVDFLENAFLVRRLPAYSANIRKRLIKAPKLYWRDTGLLHALLQLGPADDLFVKPWVGSSWEGWVIEQILNRLQTAGHTYAAHYLRTSDQYEIDLVLELQGKLVAIEIKLTSTPDLADLERLQHVAKFIKADRCLLISRTKELIDGRTAASLNLSAAIQYLLDL
ncbi:MAG: ATP-binding protein [Verrucomicrobiae bacterium]|nr:ATP-binding protein [Verrucomicrobiae bacterium]